MNISSIGSGGLSAADFAAFRKQQFQKDDANNDGSLDQAEFRSAVQNAPKPPGANGASAPDSAELFKKLDTNGDQKVSQAEAEAGAPEKQGARPAGGPPPGGAPPAGGGGKSSGSSEASSSNKVYDKKDANQDGKVSYDEELAYAQKHPDVAKQDAAKAQVSKPANADGTGIYLNTVA